MSTFSGEPQYGVATGSGPMQHGWNTQVRLFPAAREPFGWDEQITTGPARDEVVNKVPVELIDSYTFPVHSATVAKNSNSTSA